MIDLKFKFWDSIAKRFCDDSDIFISSNGEVYHYIDGEMILAPFAVPVQSTTFTAPCGREIWFGDIYYNSGYGNLHIKTMSDVLLLVEGLAENDIGAYLGNEYENPGLLS